MAESTKRYAVVTGSNKGIGFETVRQLALKGITVVLSARDEKRGLEAVKKLQQSGISGQVIFHELDVADTSSIASLAQFIKTQFGKLDILVNNAGIAGAIIDADGFRAAIASDASMDSGEFDFKKLFTETCELAEECLQINYYGAKLKNIPSDKVKGVFSTNDENLSQKNVNEVLTEFLNDLKEGFQETKGWPHVISAYTVSKAAMNAYTRTVEEGAASVVNLALLPNDGPTGQFFIRSEVQSP